MLSPSFLREDRVNMPKPSPQSSDTLSSIEKAEPRSGKLWTGSSFWAYLQQDVDPAMCTAPLAAFCFMTGFMYGLCWTCSVFSYLLAMLYRSLQYLYGVDSRLETLCRCVVV